MTSLQYVVHPLPGTEEQFNDRYFIKRKMLCKLPSLWCVELSSIFILNDVFIENGERYD